MPNSNVKKYIKSIGTQYYILDLIQTKDDTYQIVVERSRSTKILGTPSTLEKAEQAFDSTRERLENEYAIAAT